MLFVFLVGVWEQNYQGILDDRVNENMRGRATQVADLLVKTTGYPTDWNLNPGAARSIGLATKEYVLSPTKVNAFAGVDYNTAKEKLGVQNYEFHFRIIGLDTGNSTLDTKIGRDTNNDTKAAFQVRRIVTYGSANSGRAEVRFTLWKR